MYEPRAFEHTPRAVPAVLGRPLGDTPLVTDVYIYGDEAHDVPAVRIKRFSNLLFNAAHALLESQSSLPQQHTVRSGGSGDGTRLKLERAAVRSSMVAVALRRLLGESGVSGRDLDIVAFKERMLRVVRAKPGDLCRTE